MSSMYLSDLRRAQSERALRYGCIVLIGITFGFVGLFGRVVQLKVFPDPRLPEAVGSPLSTQTEVNRRGDILDRCDRVIATSTIGFRLFVDPDMVEDPATIAVDLAALIKGDPIEIDQKICARSNSRYVVVDHLIEDWQVSAVRGARIRGVGLEPRLVRQYPHESVAGRFVGEVGFEHTGLGGCEYLFNRDLTPDHGKLIYLRDVRRQALWIEPAQYNPGDKGHDVRLSIDLVIQDIAEERLEQAVREYNSGGGRVIVVDSVTGEILAMTDILNHRPGWDEPLTDPLRDVKPRLGRNRCVTDPYEPGSTMKPFIWSVATELEKARLGEKLPIPDGPWRTPYGRTIREAHYYGPSTWRTVLIKSMNIGMAMIAERMTHNEMQIALARFKFGVKTECGLPGETAGIVTSPREWRNYTQTSVAMGHEIAVTPLQMVRAFCAFARDGSIPHLTIRAIAPTNQNLSHQAVSKDIALLTREVMREVMTDGTGRLAQSTRYHLFGKSGTAQLPRRTGKGYHEHRYVSSFIAGAPYANPRIVVICVIDDPDRKKGHYGGTVAAPVVRDIIDETLQYLGVPPEKSPIDDEA